MSAFHNTFRIIFILNAYQIIYCRNAVQYHQYYQLPAISVNEGDLVVINSNIPGFDLQGRVGTIVGIMDNGYLVQLTSNDTSTFTVFILGTFITKC